MIIAFISEWLGVIAVTWIFSINPRLKQQPVGFLYPRRDGIAALSLYALILVFSFLYARFAPPRFPDPLHYMPGPAHDLQQALIFAGISLLPFLAALVIRRQPPRSAGWKDASLRPALQLGIAMALLTIFLRNRVMDVLGGVDSAGATALLVALGIALAEETIFRGYIHMRLAWWLGTWPGLILTAALFAMWHLPFWLPALLPSDIAVLLGLTFAQGLVLGWIMTKSGHVLAPALYRAVSIWISVLG